jgi:quercetin dioxygenase-like cupin family protein
MAHLDQQIKNSRTGQRMTFVGLERDSLRIDSVNPPTDEREPLHVHPKQESGAKLVSGSLVFEVDGVQRKLAPGDSISIAPNAPHRFWNDGHEDAHSIGFFRPALATAEFFETLFALANAGKLDAKGMPHPLQLAVMVPRFGDEIRTVRPPWLVLRAVAMVLKPLARALGYKSTIAAQSPSRGA